MKNQFASVEIINVRNDRKKRNVASKKKFPMLINVGRNILMLIMNWSFSSRVISISCRSVPTAETISSHIEPNFYPKIHALRSTTPLIALYNPPVRSHSRWKKQPKRDWSEITINKPMWYSISAITVWPPVHAFGTISNRCIQRRKCPLGRQRSTWSHWTHLCQVSRDITWIVSILHSCLTDVDLHQLYLNNVLQYHQLKLQQLYEMSQALLVDQPRLTEEFQGCLNQMQYHCLEALHLQHPGYALSFPYLPFYHPRHLSYRHEELDDSDSIDDRLTIDTCHGLIEYCRELISICLEIETTFENNSLLFQMRHWMISCVVSKSYNVSVFFTPVHRITNLFWSRFFRLTGSQWLSANARIVARQVRSFKKGDSVWLYCFSLTLTPMFIRERSSRNVVSSYCQRRHGLIYVEYF